MSTEGKPESQPVSTNQRGAWNVDHPGAPSPFGVQWREKFWDEATKTWSSRKRTEFFPREADRDKRRRQVITDKLANRSPDATREEMREWRAFMTAADGVPWQTIFTGYQQWLSGTGQRMTATYTVEAWRKRYIATAKHANERGEISDGAYGHKKRYLEQFATSFGHIRLDTIIPDQIETWIDGLGHESPFTFNSIRKVLYAFFNAPEIRRQLKHNPIDEVPRRRAHVDNRTRILTPQQTAQLFLFAMENEKFKPMLCRLAAEAFVGIRFSSGCRLSQADIRTAEREMMLPAQELKTGQESGEGHLISGMPEQIWAWLEIAPESGWALAPRQYLELKSMLFIAANVPHPPNCLRKSFCTYDLALHRNAGRTAFLLGHTDQKQLWRSYKGNASHRDGFLYQAITPGTVREIARGGWPPTLDLLYKAPGPRGGSASAGGLGYGA